MFCPCKWIGETRALSFTREKSWPWQDVSSLASAFPIFCLVFRSLALPKICGIRAAFHLPAQAFLHHGRIFLVGNAEPLCRGRDHFDHALPCLYPLVGHERDQVFRFEIAGVLVQEGLETFLDEGKNGWMKAPE